MAGPRELSMSMICLFAVFLVVTSDTMSGAQLDIIKQVASAEDQASLEASLQEALDKLRLNTLTIGRAQPGSVTAVVGGGLSGLTAALHLLEKGLPVALIDKSKFMGGNSAKASSGKESRLFPNCMLPSFLIVSTHFVYIRDQCSIDNPAKGCQR